ncbi:MAG: uL14 family ribosomal protein [DPANN group archaeon]|nr:uL14 family ribosomal protein [DPANN group archaeon]
MKAIAAKHHSGVTHLSIVKCDDNSGAKTLKVIAQMGFKGTKKRRPTIGVGDVFKASVIKGKPAMRKKIVKCVLIRQKHEYRRRTGDRVKFDENAAVLITDKNEPVGSEIKGAVAKEIAERFPRISTIAKNVI